MTPARTRDAEAAQQTEAEHGYGSRLRRRGNGRRIADVLALDTVHVGDEGQVVHDVARHVVERPLSAEQRIARVGIAAARPLRIAVTHVVESVDQDRVVARVARVVHDVIAAAQNAVAAVVDADARSGTEVRPREIVLPAQRTAGAARAGARIGIVADRVVGVHGEGYLREAERAALVDDAHAEVQTIAELVVERRCRIGDPLPRREGRHHDIARRERADLPVGGRIRRRIADGPQTVLQRVHCVGQVARPARRTEHVRGRTGVLLDGDDFSSSGLPGPCSPADSDHDCRGHADVVPIESQLRSSLVAVEN